MENRRDGERGQVMILAALMMTVLLGFLALVIDLGNGFAQRRFMQNASDAAAVAGARVLALNWGSGTSDAAVLNAINTYLAANGEAETVTGDPLGPANRSRAWYTTLDGTRIREVGGLGVPPVPVGSSPVFAGVEIEAGRQFDTYFARVMGIDTMNARAAATGMYGVPSDLLLNSTLSGVTIGPLAFDEMAYWNGLAECGGYGATVVFNLYIDTPTECISDTEVHFSYSTLNIGTNCSNNTVREVAELLINNPGALGDTRIEVGDNVQVCHGARLANPSLIANIGQPFLVPLIDHAAASVCSPQCWAPIVGFAYIRITSWGGSGINSYYIGHWVDPRGLDPIRGSGVTTTSVPITGPVSFAMTR